MDKVELTSIESYSFDEHRHTFSVWCGATAAGASSLCRFKIETGKKIIENALLKPPFKKFEALDEFDKWHDEMCQSLKREAQTLGLKSFTYGIAAKMLNCYLKAFFISCESDSTFLHPPIDRILLQTMAAKDFDGKKLQWRSFAQKGWSKLYKTYSRISSPGYKFVEN